MKKRPPRGSKKQAGAQWIQTAADIALRCLRIMHTQGISQKILAERMGVSPQQVSKILKGKENLTLETIEKLEHARGDVLIDVPRSQEDAAPAASPTTKRPRMLPIRQNKP